MSQTAVIFPGQGAQAIGMGRDVAEAFPAARQVFDDANRILGFDLAAICFNGPAERLNATDISQPAIFTMSIAMWRTMQSLGMTDDIAPAAMAGLSLGEYTALHAAGWISFEEGVRLVAERGRLMQSAAEAQPGGMVSLIGMDESQATRLCQDAANGEVLAPANFNCPGQIVISGSKTACERAVAAASQHGGRAIPLTVAGAFHSPLMAPAVKGLHIALAATPIRPTQIRVVSNVSADYHAAPESVRNLLCEQVAEPTRWQASVERLIADGFDRFVEVGPGRVLTGLMKKINRSVAAQNFSTAADVVTAQSARQGTGAALDRTRPRERVG